ncbi:MAG: MHS family MFS transporter [Caulobacterales bacterium]|nr:MHS family MFS transporter [Caulobacterales bacterium]
MTTTAVNTPHTRRVLTASLVGTAVEFYDFYIYATAAALVFGPLFFPAESASAQLMASWATFAIAFIARPVGAVFFGHFGDRIGRKSTLVASLMLMGGATFAIAFLPTYAQAGWIAPFLLCVLRFGQGFGLGGEWGGAALLAVENAPPGWRARFGMFPQLGAPVGFLAANGFFLLLGLFLTQEQFTTWGWRIPFLASAALVIIGLWVRLKLTETPEFKAAMEKAPPAHAPLGEVLVKHWPQVIGGTLGAIACFATYYVATAFALGYGVTTLGYARETFLIVQLIAILFLAVGIIWAGWWSDKSSPRTVLITGCMLTVIASFALAPLMGSGSLLLIGAFLALAQLLMGLVYGPLGAWLPGLFPARVRYTGASIAFNVGGILGGGLTPLISAQLVEMGGLRYVGFYLGAATALSFIALFLLKPTPEKI